MAIVICITGHIKIYKPEEVRNDISYFFKYIKDTNPNEEIFAISSMAAGADTIFAEEAMDAHIPLKIIFPFQLEEYQNDFETRDWEKVNNILKKQGNRFETSEQIEIGNEEQRKLAYLKTGQRLVDEATIVLAVWDGKEANGTGGTGEIVEYAIEHKKELHIIKGIKDQKGEQQLLPDEEQNKFDQLDKNAVNYKKWIFTPSWRLGIVFGFATVIFFSVKTIFITNENKIFILSVLEILSLALSFFLLDYLARKWKTKFLKARRNAEYLRSALWFRDAGIPIPIPDKVGFTPDEDVSDMEKRMAAKIDSITNLPNAKRITWALAQEQIDYQVHTRKKRSEVSQELITNSLHFIKWFFVVVAILNFVFEVFHHYHIGFVDYELLRPWFYFLLVILPPMYASLEGVKYFGEYKKDIEVARETINGLEKIKNQISKITDENDLNKTARELREVLEIENIDWAVRLNIRQIEKAL